MALVFTLAGMVGVLVTVIAFNSRPYHDLSRAYAAGRDDDNAGGGAAVASPVGSM
ncbi:MAG: hypothetical protein MO852_04655 [Candidatus Devosia euplotis]|nr:hypothetical protein [Candidatus Devosia euplotis]